MKAELSRATCFDFRCLDVYDDHSVCRWQVVVGWTLIEEQGDVAMNVSKNNAVDSVSILS
jgi:hypothetical protein